MGGRRGQETGSLAWERRRRRVVSVEVKVVGWRSLGKAGAADPGKAPEQLPSTTSAGEASRRRPAANPGKARDTAAAHGGPAAAPSTGEVAGLAGEP